jgi:hypothetical protein
MQYYDSYPAYVRPLSRHQDVSYERSGNEPILFWDGWKPIIVCRSSLSTQVGQTGSCNPTVVSFVRGTFTPDKLINAAMEAWNQQRHAGSNDAKRFRIERKHGFRSRGRAGSNGPHGSNGPQEIAGYADSSKAEANLLFGNRLTQWKLEDIGDPVAVGDPFSSLALPDAASEMIGHAQRWLKSEQWYKAKKIPWRIGFLLYGTPGTGKSSLVKAMAQSLDMPLFTFDLATFDNNDFSGSWSSCLRQAPCIVLLEDIDAVFHGRDNVTKGKEGDGVTFDCLLNHISGVGDSSGVMVVVTTNRVELLDEALGVPDASKGGFSTRPGRIDRAVELPLLTASGRRYIANRILADCPQEIDRVVAEGDNDSGAQFEDRCSRVALDHYWSPESH